MPAGFGARLRGGHSFKAGHEAPYDVAGPGPIEFPVLWMKSASHRRAFSRDDSEKLSGMKAGWAHSGHQQQHHDRRSGRDHYPDV